MTDAQVNDCAERLSQLGIPVNGSTNPKVGYIKNPMACERCVYGSGQHASWCLSPMATPAPIIVGGRVLLPGETIAQQLGLRKSNCSRYPRK